ncbi:MAG TPA: rhodanese-like domain-containing protein [Anaerolineales bacterium]|nr:rhodanese-like domain-containing protein [Anaerolineales bacterium]
MKKKLHGKKQQAGRNNPLLWGLLALLILAIPAIWLGTRNATVSNSLPREISVQEAATKRDAGAFILDVRQPNEWSQYHIEGATLIPLGELASRVNELPRDQEIVVVCHSGNRSAKGRDILLHAGFTRVTSMAGGLIQWQGAGYPIVSGP